MDKHSEFIDNPVDIELNKPSKSRFLFLLGFFGFFVFFIGGPFLFILAGIVAATRFRLGPKESRVLSAELERLRAGGAMEEATPETVAVCEAVSGKPYKDCWKAPKP